MNPVRNYRTIGQKKGVSNGVNIKFNHVGMFTKHPKRLLNFYLTKLGFKKEYQTILPKSVVYSIFKINAECIMARLTRNSVVLEIFWFRPSGCEEYELKTRVIGAVGYNHFGLELKDIDKFCNGLKQKFGVKVIRVNRGSHYNCFIQDPDKNLIEIKQENRLRR